MEAPFRSLAVANRFVELGNEAGRPVTLLKLLKLVYFADGWHLALTDKKLITSQVEAWKFGPVVPSVYHAFKENKTNPITDLGMDFVREGTRIKFVAPKLEYIETLDRFMRRMWDIYGKLSAFQLSELTHQPGTPWYKAWHDLGGSEIKGTDIPEHLIKEYFKEKLEKQKPAHA